MYVHEDETKKRRIVKFRDEEYRRKRSNRHSFPSTQSNNSVMGTNSLMDGVDEDDMEPENIDSADQNSSLMNQVANHILGSINSWEAAAMVCGNETAEQKMSLADVGGSSKHTVSRQPRMEVEWEGQEVQLLDRKTEQDSFGSDERMPPPVARQKPIPDMASSLGMSSLGSCHSWLPEQFESAASFFSTSKGPGGVSPSGSIDMEYSVGGADNSNGGSVGGGSLTKVFETDTISDGHHVDMGSQTLNQVPSWERSLLSRSPLSLASDDESVVSKSSTRSGKGSDRVLSSGLVNFSRDEKSTSDSMMSE